MTEATGFETTTELRRHPPQKGPTDRQRQPVDPLRKQGFGSWLPESALRANPFPEVTDLFCRLPLPTLFYRLEAIHLGDLMRL